MEQEAPPLHSSLANPPATATPLVEPPDVEMNDDDEPQLLAEPLYYAHVGDAYRHYSPRSYTIPVYPMETAPSTQSRQDADTAESRDLDLIFSQSGTHLDRTTVRRVYRHNGSDVVNTILELTDHQIPASPPAPRPVDENAPPDAPLTLMQMLSVESWVQPTRLTLQDRLEVQRREESEPPVTPPRRPTAAAREEAPPPAPRRRAGRHVVGRAYRANRSVDQPVHWQDHPLQTRNIDMDLQQVQQVQRVIRIAQEEWQSIGMSAPGEASKGLPAEELPIKPVPVSELHALVCEFIDTVSKQTCAFKDTVPVEFCCPISLMALRDPRCAADGHIYEKDFFLGMAARAAAAGEPLISPMTRENLGGGQLFPVHSMVSLMERWVRERVPVPEGVSLEKQLFMAVASPPVEK